MNTQEFLSRLRELDIRLWVEGNSLRLDAPKGVLTPNLRAELAERKADILAYLQPADVSLEPATSLIRLASRDDPLPLSFAQQQLWFLDQLIPGSSVYNIFTGLHFQAQVDTAAMEKSINEVIRRHESLRTIFPLVDDQPVQRIVPFHPQLLHIIDLRHLPDGEREDEARRLATEDSQHAFDLAQGPLFRATLVQLAEEEYELLFNMHHIISDGWSIGVLVTELEFLYRAFSTGKMAALPELPIQYADFAVWQRQWFSDIVLHDQLEFWKQHLAGPLPILELPTDYRRPATQTFRGASYNFTVARDLVSGLNLLGKRAQSTLFMTLLAAFNILLFRYTGQQDLIIGTPVSGRNRVELEKLIGLFVNTLALRTELNENLTFLELLTQVRKVSLDAFAHPDVPFELLVETLHPERDANRSPLFQVMFVFEKATISPMDIDIGAAKFDLTLFFWEEKDQLTGHIEYSTDLFQAATIRRMAGHLQTLLAGIVANPDLCIMDLPLLTKEEEQLMHKWNETESGYPGDACLHQLFEAQVEQNPDRVAVLFEDQRLTYRQLNDRANQLARYLQSLGVTSETLVGISLERSDQMVIGLLGILKAGGTYIPLDPLFPQDRLDFMLENSDARILITQEGLRSTEAKAHNLRIVDFDNDWPLISQYPVENLPVNTQPQNLAYIIFTSGSTGKPKGVQIPHRAVVNFLTSMRQKPGLTANDKLLSVTTLSFDISVLEIFLPLTTGACVVVTPGDAIYDGTALIRHLSTHNITVMQATPVTWQMLIAAGWQGDKNLKVLCGGEAMSKELARWLTSHVRCVWNMYGPTETTVWSTIREILPETDVITIGYPIANTRIYILDKNLEPVPVGVAGELYIAGDGVARGYLKQPELTAEKFVPDLFCNKANACMYKTGDQARFLEDGQIDFLGRLDFQVKVRGFRIELEEIETVLNNQPDIHQAVVIAREDTPGDKRLVAYLIPEENSKPQIGDLRQSIRAKLPEYMLPSSFVFLDEFPTTPNRKVNRKALPVPDQSESMTKRDFVPPRTDIENKLASIWANILGVVQIDVRDSFFELGGHSLLAVRMFARIKEEFGINLPLATLFQEATVEQLARVITSKTVSINWPSLVEIEPHGDQPPFFCIHGITGDILWFRELAKCLAPNYPFYGLQARGLDGIQNPISQIEEMAARYIEEIRVLQPNGPYLLGGASLGGTVALEIAQQLLQQGEKIALLAIFDDSPPNIKIEIDYQSLRNRLVMGGKLIRNFPYWLREFLQLGPSRMLMRIRRKIRLAKKARGQIGMDKPEQIDATDIIDFAPELPFYRQQLITSHYQALKMYTPQPYPGQVTLFRAKSRPLLNTFDPEAGWQSLASGRVSVIEIPSSHEGMFRKPHVFHLAQALKSCIDSVSDQGQHIQDGINKRWSENLLYILFTLLLMPLIA